MQPPLRCLDYGSNPGMDVVTRVTTFVVTRARLPASYPAAAGAETGTRRRTTGIRPATASTRA